MAVDIGRVTALRCVSGRESNLYFQIKGNNEAASQKTYVIKSDDPAIGIYAAMLTASASTRITVSVESEVYSPQPNYHEVTQIYAGEWRP
jgi:hypothetical protein